MNLLWFAIVCREPLSGKAEHLSKSCRVMKKAPGFWSGRIPGKGCISGKAGNGRIFGEPGNGRITREPEEDANGEIKGEERRRK